MPTNELRVFVYGHYDSRGGTTAIAAPDRHSADHIYMAELYYIEWDPEKGCYFLPPAFGQPRYDFPPEPEGTFLEDDFLGEAILRSESPFPDDDADIDDASMGVVFAPGSDDGEFWQGPNGPATPVLIWVAQPYKPQAPDYEPPYDIPGYHHPRWDDDAFSFVLMNRS